MPGKCAEFAASHHAAVVYPPAEIGATGNLAMEHRHTGSDVTRLRLQAGVVRGGSVD